MQIVREPGVGKFRGNCCSSCRLIVVAIVLVRVQFVLLGKEGVQL